MSDDGTPRTEGLNDSEKLLVLAAWFDMWDRPDTDRRAILDDDRNPGKNDVQRDLRRIARALVTPDPTQPHGVSGLFHHAPGAPCVVCDRLVTPDPAPDFDIEDLTAANLAAGEEARRANRAEAELAAIRAQGGGLDVERLATAMRTYYGKGDGHIVPLGLRDKFGLPDIWPELAEGIAAEYARLPEADPFGNHRLACGCLSDGNQTIMLCREHGQEAADHAD